MNDNHEEYNEWGKVKPSRGPKGLSLVNMCLYRGFAYSRRIPGLVSLV